MPPLAMRLGGAVCVTFLSLNCGLHKSISRSCYISLFCIPGPAPLCPALWWGGMLRLRGDDNLCDDEQELMGSIHNMALFFKTAFGGSQHIPTG